MINGGKKETWAQDILSKYKSTLTQYLPKDRLNAGNILEALEAIADGNTFKAIEDFGGILLRIKISDPKQYLRKIIKKNEFTMRLNACLAKNQIRAELYNSLHQCVEEIKNHVAYIWLYKKDNNFVVEFCDAQLGALFADGMHGEPHKNFHALARCEVEGSLEATLEESIFNRILTNSKLKGDFDKLDQKIILNNLTGGHYCALAKGAPA